MIYFWLKARDNNIPIGSGKISRRIKKYRQKKRKAFTPPKTTSTIFKSNKSFTGGKSDKVKSRLDFPSSACKIIFLHWQRLGYPFTKHREVESKTTARAIALIEKNRKKDGMKAVINSMDTCRLLFTADWFKYRIYVQLWKISLGNFFRFPSGLYQNVLKKAPSSPRSWYKECQKNKTRLKKKYCVQGNLGDLNLTKQLATIWNDYTLKEISRDEYQKLSSLAIKIKKSGKANKQVLDHVNSDNAEQFIISIFKDMLIQYKTYQPKHIGWLLTDTFLNEEIPKEVIRQNLLTADQLRWKRI